MWLSLYVPKLTFLLAHGAHADAVPHIMGPAQPPDYAFLFTYV